MKSIEELEKMSTKEREDYFESLPASELKNYYGRGMRGMLYNMMNIIYIRKKAESYDKWLKYTSE